MRLLVTGFGPYPGVTHNPTAALARRVAASPRLKRLGIEAAAHVFTVSYAVVAAELPRLLDATRPDAVLHIGLAPRERMLRIEMRGENRRRMLHPDVTGRAPSRQRLDASGVAERGSTAPGPTLLAALKRAGVPVRISRDAGAYLCNATLYWSLGHAAGRSPSPPTVFIHCPRPRRLGHGHARTAAAEVRAMRRMETALIEAAVVLARAGRAGLRTRPVST